MRKILIIVIAVLLAGAIALGLYNIPIPRHINMALDGYILYKDGTGVSCRVTIAGKYRDYLFENEKHMDMFDGIITADDALIGLGIEEDRVVFKGDTGRTSYTWSKSATNGPVTLIRQGDRLLSKKCDALIVSCCYDNVNKTDTSDETYRCLLIAPARNPEEANSIIASFRDSGNLEKFETWHFE